MTSSADTRAAFAALLLCALALVAPASRAEVAADAFTLALNDRVRARVASRWSVAFEAVALEWSRTPEAAASRAPFELLGRGTDGEFVVALGEGMERAAFRVKAGVREEVAVATRAIATGERLNDSDLRMEPRVTLGPPRSVPEAATVAKGWEARRPIAAGEVLARPAFMPPPVIAAGEPVQMTWTQGAVRVALSGVALHAARLGEPVRVRVAPGAGARRGIALAPGIVRLTPEVQR